VNALGQENAHDASGSATLESAASALGLQLISFEVRAETDLPIALERIASTNVDALLVRADPQILVPHRAAILAFTRRHRLPAMYPWKYFVEVGG
jgi:putative tryptophan/tyrosine transport system substrate-binding protein